jgi:hypothetical protein
MNARLREQPHTASAEPLLSRLDKVMKSGNGWRARCPAHDGTGRTLTVAESDDRVLVHCFAGCKAVDVLTAVGMTWADIQPPKHWPQTREEKRKAQRAIREVGLLCAFEALWREGEIILAGGRHIAALEPLSAVDMARLSEAVDRVSGALITMRDFDYWQRREARS